MGQQLRLDPKTRLGDLAKDIITGFETVLRYNKQPVQWGHPEKTQLIRLVRNRLARVIKRYTACGGQSRCHAASSPVHPNPSQPPAQKSQRILLVEEGLPAICLELETVIFARFYPRAQDAVWLPLKPELDRVAEETLHPVLYENPFCNDCPLCSPDTRLSPWQG